MLIGGYVLAADAARSTPSSKSGKPNAEWTQWGGSSDAEQHAGGPQHSDRMEHRRDRLPHRHLEPEEGEERQVGRAGSARKVRQPGRRRRPRLHRHEQQRRLAQAVSARSRSRLLLCFDIKDGKFLWQHSSEKLPTGRVHDWPLQGVCSTPLVEGNRLWFVTNRGEVRCLDTEGFYDGKNDGRSRERTTRTKTKPTSSGSST